MPIVDIESVCAPGEGLPDAAAQVLADALAVVLGVPAGRLWVRLHDLPDSAYAENGPAGGERFRPVFVRVLHADLPDRARLRADSAAIGLTVAHCLDRPVDQVHVEHAPAARGRIAFGGRLLEDEAVASDAVRLPSDRSADASPVQAGPFTISAHDDHPLREAALVDAGLGEANDAAAPLHEVRPLSCFAHDAAGQVVGGAVGRRWGHCCELQQLWVRPFERRRGIGARLVRAFEDQARRHGCTVFFLETFSFQAPGLYRALGYETVHSHTAYPHGIVRFLMVKQAATDAPGEGPA